jgi:hypothetical protein
MTSSLRAGLPRRPTPPAPINANEQKTTDNRHELDSYPLVGDGDLGCPKWQSWVTRNASYAGSGSCYLILAADSIADRLAPFKYCTVPLVHHDASLFSHAFIAAPSTLG